MMSVLLSFRFFANSEDFQRIGAKMQRREDEYIFETRIETTPPEVDFSLRGDVRSASLSLRNLAPLR
jgi:hypothetical protein